jgi:hypothetical protein
VSDIGYTYGYYPELNPLRVRLALLHAGWHVPEVKHACDMGFGQGISINVHAAASGVQWLGTDSWQSLGLTGLEVIDVLVHPQLLPQSEAVLRVTRADGTVLERALRLRIDTPIEATYYRHGGILPYVLRDLLSKA